MTTRDLSCTYNYNSVETARFNGGSVDYVGRCYSN